MVMIGTEDQEFLEQRLGKNTFATATDLPVTYSERGMVVRVPSGGMNSVSLQFIVAWNSDPEPAECSCWYAVDVVHANALTLTAG